MIYEYILDKKESSQMNEENDILESIDKIEHKEVEDTVTDLGLRPLGQVLLDLETVIDEMVDHELQWGDILALVHVHLQVHNPESQEQYSEPEVNTSSRPEFYYGPKR